MTENDDLYTDYALQLFVAYINEDTDGMRAILQGFSQEDHDEFFMPGLLYGILYHFATVVRLFCETVGGEAEELMASYAVDYAISRENLVHNPLLNVNLAKNNIEEIKRLLEQFEQE